MTDLVIKPNDTIVVYNDNVQYDIVYTGDLNEINCPIVLYIEIINGVCRLHKETWNINYLSVLKIYEDSPIYCVVLSIAKEEIKLRRFKKIMDAYNFSKQYSDLI